MSNGYNLWIKRAGGRTRKKSPNDPQSAQSLYGSLLDAKPLTPRDKWRLSPISRRLLLTLLVFDNATKTDRPRRAAQTVAGRFRHRRTTPHAADPRQRAARAEGRQAARHGHRSRNADHRASAISPARTARPRRSARASCRICCARCPTTPQINVDATGSKMTVRAGRSRFNLQTLAASDYPRISVGQEQLQTLSLPQRDFRALLKLAEFAMAQQDIRYYLNGMLLVVDQGIAAGGGNRRPPAVVGEPRDRRRLHAAGSDPAAQDRARARRSCSTDSDDAADDRHPREPGALPLRQRRARDRRSSTASFPTTTASSRRATASGSSSIARRCCPRCSARRSCRTRNSAACASCWATISSRSSARTASRKKPRRSSPIGYTGEPLDIGFNITYLLDVLSNVTQRQGVHRVRRRELERARHDARARRLQVRRHADAHLITG